MDILFVIMIVSLVILSILGILFVPPYLKIKSDPQYYDNWLTEKAMGEIKPLLDKAIRLTAALNNVTLDKVKVLVHSGNNGPSN